MDVFEAIRNRHAVREFTSEPVARDEVERLIGAAVLAPSAMNLQPWRFIVICGRERLLKLSEDAKAHILKTMPKGSPLERYKVRLSEPAFDIFYGAPALVIVAATSDESGACEDCALAAQNLMLAAHAMGLGTCWIGFARPWLNEPAAKAEIGIPETLWPVAPVIVGHPKGQPERHPRRAPDIIWIGS